MGDVAASGGYWISTSSDEVIADAGDHHRLDRRVRRCCRRADKALDKLGVHADGVDDDVARRRRDPRLPLDPRFGALVQTSIDHIYADFTDQGRAGAQDDAGEDRRGRAGPRLDRRAGARSAAWSTRSAATAMRSDSAATRAKLATRLPRRLHRARPGRLARLVEMFNAPRRALVGATIDEHLGALGAAGARWLSDLGRDLGWVAEIVDRRKPFAAVVHCLCGRARAERRRSRPATS